MRSGMAMSVGVAVLVAVLAGCGKKAPAIETMAPQEAAQTFQSVFKDAPAEAKSSANEVAASLQSENSGKAFLQLQELSKRSDLTADQTAAAVATMASVRANLATAAARGDKAAAELLEMYRSTK